MSNNLLEQILEKLKDQGRFTIFHNREGWAIGLEWGIEAEGSQMFGSAAYVSGKTFAEAIKQLNEDTHLSQ